MSVNTFVPSPSGTLYGVVLNDQSSIERMGAGLREAPYKAEPKAPILYIKPANTRSESGATIILPPAADRVEIGATLGVIIGRPAYRLSLDDAAQAVAGYLPVADLSLPHSSYYRPAIREKCFDGSCVLGAPVPAQHVADPSALVLRTRINGAHAQDFPLSSLLRKVPELLHDVTEFMTLSTGDVLLVGVLWQAATARAGDRVEVEAEGLGQIAFTIGAQAQEAA